MSQVRILSPRLNFPYADPRIPRITLILTDQTGAIHSFSRLGFLLSISQTLSHPMCTAPLPCILCIPHPIYAPPYYLCIEKSSKASAHHTLIRVIPGKKREEINLGSSGRGAIMFTLAYTSLASRGSSRAPPNGREYSNGWVICQHKSWKTCYKNTAGSIRAAFSPRE